LATIRDVAKSAGVSIATVSRVLNDSSRVSEGTRSRVWAAFQELDFWPNEAARSLTRRRTNVLGVFLPDLFGEFFSEIIRGIDHAARRESLQTLISSCHADTNAMLSAARTMQGRIDGAIVMAPDEGSAEAIDRIRGRFPVVLLNPRFDVVGCATISVANFAGAYAIVKHLLHLGHDPVAILSGPAGNVDADERLRGWRRALADAGTPADPSLELAGDFTESSGYRAASELLRHPRRPRAVFASNDSMAIGLISAFGSMGIDVPRTVAVAGFDDIAIARYLTPPLTTAHVDAYRLGEEAVRLLLASDSASEAPPEHVVLPCPLVVRESCGADIGRERDSSDEAKPSIPERDWNRSSSSGNERGRGRT
jgi:LacI family transcriptional regulator